MTAAWLRDPRLIVYLLVGGAVAVIYYAVFVLFRPAFGDFYAVTLSYVLAVSAHFLLNNFVTFHASGVSITLAKIARYGVVLAVNYVASSAVVLTLLPMGAPPVIALAAGITATTALGFSLNRAWVFHDQRR